MATICQHDSDRGELSGLLLFVLFVSFGLAFVMESGCGTHMRLVLIVIAIVIVIVIVIA